VAAKASNVASSEVAAAEATDVAAAEAVAAAKAAHVAAAVSSSSAVSTAATGLCASGSKAAGKHGTCQDHHHSSSHNILRFDGRNFRHRASSDVGMYAKADADVATDSKWECSFFVTIKFQFNHSS
jgi:hypothetical protein